FQCSQLRLRKFDAIGDFGQCKTAGSRQCRERLAQRLHGGWLFTGGISGDIRFSGREEISVVGMGLKACMRSLMRVRSLASPASWPQAASISSPRVLRTVVITP